MHNTHTEKHADKMFCAVETTDPINFITDITAGDSGKTDYTHTHTDTHSTYYEVAQRCNSVSRFMTCLLYTHTHYGEHF